MNTEEHHLNFHKKLIEMLHEHGLTDEQLYSEEGVAVKLFTTDGSELNFTFHFDKTQSALDNDD